MDIVKELDFRCLVTHSVKKKMNPYKFTSHFAQFL